MRTSPIQMGSENGTDEVASVASEFIDLDDEIEAIVADMRATDDMIQTKVDTRTVLQQIASQYWPDATVKVYGSFSYNLATTKSELDLIVEGCTPFCGDILTRFMNHLDQQTLPNGDKAWENLSLMVTQQEGFARIRTATGVTVNISFSTDVKSGMRSTSMLVSSLLRKYPAASSVYFVIRRFMMQKSLCTPNEGGMSNYGVLIMLLHVCANEPSREVLSNPTMLLTAFLRYFGLKVNFQTTTMSVFETTSEERNHTNDTISIEDPSNPSINVAQGCTKSVEIKTSLQRVYDLIKQREATGKGQSLVVLLAKGKSKKWRSK